MKKSLKCWQRWLLTAVVIVISLVAELGLLSTFLVMTGDTVPVWLSITTGVGALLWLLFWVYGVNATNWLTAILWVVAMSVMGASWMVFFLMAAFWFGNVLWPLGVLLFSALAVWLKIEDAATGGTPRTYAPTGKVVVVRTAVRVVPSVTMMLFFLMFVFFSFRCFIY